MRKDTLTLFPYFGGKSRFAKEIAGLLDYYETTVYIEPFGGAASVLLNKMPHQWEIYSDVSLGLSALMRCLSNNEQAEKLMDLLDQTIYTKECFNQCKAFRNKYDDNYLVLCWKQLKRKVNPLIKKIERAKGIKIEDDDRIDCIIDEYIRETETRTADKNSFTDEEKEKWSDIKADKVNMTLFSMTSFDGNLNLELNPDRDKDEVKPCDPVELAVVTYVTYAMSRDGMGTSFSEPSYRGQDDYCRRIGNIYKIAERLEGVIVHEGISATLSMLNASMIDGAKKTMMYIDAPYLSVEGQKNIGKPYKGQMELADHETLLEQLLVYAEAGAKILISNYDVEVYNQYLKGWTKTTIATKTSVGGKSGNTRTECLWFNY